MCGVIPVLALDAEFQPSNDSLETVRGVLAEFRGQTHEEVTVGEDCHAQLFLPEGGLELLQELEEEKKRLIMSL